MVTPPSIVPEWYFLPMYAILRSIPYKAPGVLAMGAAIVVLYLVPFLSKPVVRSNAYRPVAAIFYWLFVLNCLLLGLVGSHHVETPWVELGQVCTFLYFSYFFVVMPLLVEVEKEFFAENFWDGPRKTFIFRQVGISTRSDLVGHEDSAIMNLKERDFDERNQEEKITAKYKLTKPGVVLRKIPTREIIIRSHKVPADFHKDPSDED
jgi:hypothetical protein